MQKNQIIILIVVVVLVLGGIIGWALMQISKISSGEGSGLEEELEETFSLSAIVSQVDAEDGFLIIKPAKQENKVKVIISETTKLIRVEFPFDPKNPPKEGNFTPIQTEIELSDFQEGDNVFIKAKENIAGKTEFNNVDFVHILP